MNRSYFLLGLKTVGMFLLIFIILTLNFLALSVALQCNRGTQRQTPVATRTLDAPRVDSQSP